MTNFRHIFLSTVLFCGCLLTLHCGNSSPGAMSQERGLPSSSQATNARAEADTAPAETVIPTVARAEEAAEAAAPANPREAASTAAGARTARAVARATSVASEGLSVRRLVVATDIENREPVGASSRFDTDTDRLFAFVEAVNESDEDGELRVTFEAEDGAEVGFITLNIPANSPRWRTWAWSRNVHEVGSWTAVIRTADGAELAREHFEIEG